MRSTPHRLTENTHDSVRFLLFLFRNLSACGSYEICNLLVEQDVMTPLAALLQEVWNILQNPLSVVFVYPKHGVEFLLEVHVLGKSWICFVHVVKACSWSRGVTPFINLGNRLMWVVGFTLWLLLLLVKELTIPIGWEARWVPEPLWMFWRREKFMAVAGNWTPGYPAHILVTVLMTSRLICVLGLDTVTSQIIVLLLKLVS